MSDEIFICKESFATDYNGEAIVIPKGQRVRGGHELTRKFRDHFESADEGPILEVETATKRPNERRRGRRKRKKENPPPEPEDLKEFGDNDGETPEEATEPPAPDVDEFGGNDGETPEEDTEPVTPDRDVFGDLEGMSRDELNKAATDAGVENPEKLANKAEVVEAIQATREQ